MGTYGGMRLGERAAERLRSGRQARAGIILFVALIVFANVVMYSISTIFLFQDNIDAYRRAEIVGTAFSAIIDVVLLLFAWMLFEAFGRIERESDRVQSFMDNVYRRLP